MTWSVSWRQPGSRSSTCSAISQGASVAIAYAVRHPERVRRLLIVGGYAAGWATRGDPEEHARREAMITLTEIGWGADHPAYRQLFTNLYIPQGTTEQVQWFNDVQKMTASPENAVKIQRALSQIDVRDLLPKVRVPTLVIHVEGRPGGSIRGGRISRETHPRRSVHRARGREPYPAREGESLGRVRADGAGIPARRPDPGGRGTFRCQVDGRNPGLHRPRRHEDCLCRQRRGFSAGEGAELDHKPQH